MGDPKDGKPLARWKRLLIGGLFCAVLIFAGVTTVKTLTITDPLPEEAWLADFDPDFSAGVYFFGTIAFGAGLLTYAILFWTNCLTLSYSTRVWQKLKWRFFMAYFIVTLLMSLGLAGFVSAGTSLLSAVVGIPHFLAFIVPAVAVTIVVGLVSVWINMWAAVERKVIAKRMIAFGVLPDEIAMGIDAGISNPKKSSFKKFPTPIEDIGKLWIEKDCIRFRGDKEEFRINRKEFIRMERRADAGNVSSMAGAVDVIMHFKLADGSERQVRLHRVGCWTLRKTAIAANELAEKIEEWQKASSSA